MKRHCWNSGIVACLLVTGLFVSGATVANGQEREKPAVPPEAAVYLQNCSGANVGMAIVLIKTQEFGAKVAGRSEANKLPAELKSDITDHLGKYVTVAMPQPYEAHLLAFEVRGCSKEAASNLASAVASAFLAKLTEARMDATAGQIKALMMELESRRSEREELAKKAAAMRPADFSPDSLRYRLMCRRIIS